MLERLVCLALCLAGCSRPTPAGHTAVRRQAVSPGRVAVDDPVTGLTWNYQQGTAGIWDGDRYVVISADSAGADCITFFTDGTFEGRVHFTDDEYFAVQRLWLDDSNRVLSANYTALSNFGHSCQGPFISLALPPELFSGQELIEGKNRAYVSTVRIGPGEPFLRFQAFEGDGGVGPAVDGRLAGAVRTASVPGKYVVVSMRAQPNANPLNVDFVDPVTFATTSTASFAIDPNTFFFPQAIRSGRQLLVVSNGGLAGSDLFGRRLDAQGNVLDAADIPLSGYDGFGPGNGDGFLLTGHTADFASMRLTMVDDAGTFSAPIDPFPDFDGGLPTYGFRALPVVFGGAAPLLLAAWPTVNSGYSARAMTPSLAPAGGLVTLRPRVNWQHNVHWAPEVSGAAGFAVWVDSRQGRPSIGVRRFSSDLSPLTPAAVITLDPYGFDVSAAAFGDSALVYDPQAKRLFRAQVLANATLKVTELAPSFSLAAATLASTSTFIDVLQITYNPATMRYGFRSTIIDLNGVAQSTISVTPSSDFFQISTLSQGDTLYVAGISSTGPTDVYRIDQTNTPQVMATIPTGYYSTMYLAGDAVCLAGFDGYQCGGFDGGVGPRQTLPSPLIAVTGAFDGQRHHFCARQMNTIDAPLDWLVIEPDGGLLRSPWPSSTASCPELRPVGPNQLFMAEVVRQPFVEGPTDRAMLSIFEFTAGDGGQSVVDAGFVDAGSPDASVVDAGTVDGGLVDAGTVDGGDDAGVDAGATEDAGIVLLDAGLDDAGTAQLDSGASASIDGGGGPGDGGAAQALRYGVGCDCNSAGGLPLAMLVVAMRTRRRSPSERAG